MLDPEQDDEVHPKQSIEDLCGRLASEDKRLVSSNARSNRGVVPSGIIGGDLVSHAQANVPWFLWPFYALWRLLTFILNTTGRLLCAVLGIALMVLGTVVALTIVGAPLGVPLILLGVLLLARALF